MPYGPGHSGPDTRPQIPEPQSGIGKGMIVLLIFLGLLIAIAYYHTVVVGRDIPDENRSSLQPGLHLLDKRPFIVKVDFNELGIMTEYAWHYEINYYPQVMIPVGHVGVLTDSKGMVDPEPLPPGIHKLNLDLYDVTIVNTEKQEWRMEGESE